MHFGGGGAVFAGVCCTLKRLGRSDGSDGSDGSGAVDGVDIVKFIESRVNLDSKVDLAQNVVDARGPLVFADTIDSWAGWMCQGV